MRQYKSVIIDDEPNNRENLHRMLVRYCPTIEIVGEATSISEGIHLVKATLPEVVFLDIEMPGGSGFKMLEKLAPIEFQVIFVTAFDSYALNAIKFSALDYILKPIDKADLIEAVAKVESTQINKQDQLSNLNKHINGVQPKIALPLSDEIRLVDLNDIVRIKADNNYTEFTLTNGPLIVVSKHLGHYYDMLRDQGFLRTHQSHLINTKFLNRYVKRDGGYLILSNGDEVPVSRSQKEKVMKFFA